MSREIRKVPPDWVHPRDERDGRYIPLEDKSYREAADEWTEGFKKWIAAGLKGYFWEHEGNPPDDERHRDREWTAEEATAFQIYETVSEGTPVSPVFKTESEMSDWLLNKGYSAKATEKFIEDKWCSSMVFSNGVAYNDIESCGI